MLYTDQYHLPAGPIRASGHRQKCPRPVARARSPQLVVRLAAEHSQCQYCARSAAFAGCCSIQARSSGNAFACQQSSRQAASRPDHKARTTVPHCPQSCISSEPLRLGGNLRAVRPASHYHKRSLASGLCHLCICRFRGMPEQGTETRVTLLYGPH